MPIDEKAFARATDGLPEANKQVARGFIQTYLDFAKTEQPVGLSYCASCNSQHHESYGHCKEFTLESALDYLRAHNDGVYKITASRNCDALVVWLLNYLQRTPVREISNPPPANLKKLCDAYHQARGVQSELQSLHRRMFNNMREFTAEQALSRIDFILDALKPFEVLTEIEVEASHG